jgi:hypothetical protein
MGIKRCEKNPDCLPGAFIEPYIDYIDSFSGDTNTTSSDVLAYAACVKNGA